MHLLVQHKKYTEGSDGDNDVEVATKEVSDSLRRDRKVSADKTKKKTKAKPATPKLVKSLREDEAEGNKAFYEKIERKENFFFCKLCSKFSTASR